MSSTAAYFFGMFLGCVFTIAGSALWKAAAYKEQQHLQREAAKRRYRLEQRIQAHESTRDHDRHR